MKHNLLIIFFLLPLLSIGQIITVKQDSTGNFTTIQAAINASTDGDTVLVWPGTYFENVDFAGKNITLASRMLTTGNLTYKYNTIIDGNHSGSCVIIDDGLVSTELYGCTIQNGIGFQQYTSSGNYGGGIYLGINSHLSVKNCIIKNNFASGDGGGIFCHMYSDLTLGNTTIINNRTYGRGGGIMIGYESKLDFIDSLCNIYLNYASRGNEIIKLNSSFPLSVIVDTFTVLTPDTYYLLSSDDEGFPINDYSYCIQHQKITPVDTDLYVNPVTGSDSNSGVNPNDALKTIAFAYSKIVVDSINKNTIHLADGVYSDTLNGEKFPLNVRPFIKVAGESREGTILDGEYKSRILSGNNQVSNYSFSKMTLRRGTFVNYDDHFTDYTGLVRAYLQNDNITFDSVKFTQGWAGPVEGSAAFMACNNLRITNCEFSNNRGGAALRITLWNDPDTCYVNNCVFHANKPDDNNPEYQIGRAMDLTEATIGPGIVTNSLFTDNDDEAFISAFPSNNYLVNCTFTGNSFLRNNISFWFDASANWMYNCIVYENGGDKTFALSNVEHDGNTVLTIKNSLIQNGEESVTISSSCNGDCFLYYDSTNINTDPLFYGGVEFPYNLSDNSPCIDAGTLDLPQFILDNMPDVDLAGNPRIFNGKIDMGAYEWNPTVEVKENPATSSEQQATVITAAPNPFSSLTYISAKWDKKADVNIAVYNNAGLLVNTLQSGTQLPGSCRIPWNGTGNTGNLLPAGVYLIILTIDGKEKGSVKVVKR